jgi:hypothetical protein
MRCAVLGDCTRQIGETIAHFIQKDLPQAAEIVFAVGAAHGFQIGHVDRMVVDRFGHPALPM